MLMSGRPELSDAGRPLIAARTKAEATSAFSNRLDTLPEAKVIDVVDCAPFATGQRPITSAPACVATTIRLESTTGPRLSEPHLCDPSLAHRSSGSSAETFG